MMEIRHGGKQMNLWLLTIIVAAYVVGKQQADSIVKQIKDESDQKIQQAQAGIRATVDQAVQQATEMARQSLLYQSPVTSIIPTPAVNTISVPSIPVEAVTSTAGLGMLPVYRWGG